MHYWESKVNTINPIFFYKKNYGFLNVQNCIHKVFSNYIPNNYTFN